MILTGAGLASSDSCAAEEASRLGSRALPPRLADLAAQFEFLDPLELVFIDDHRNASSSCFL